MTVGVAQEKHDQPVAETHAAPQQHGMSEASKEWLDRNYGVPMHLLVKSVMALPQPQRDEIMGELHRRYGNLYIDAALRGEVMERPYDAVNPTPPPPIN